MSIAQRLRCHMHACADVLQGIQSQACLPTVADVYMLSKEHDACMCIHKCCEPWPGSATLNAVASDSVLRRGHSSSSCKASVLTSRANPNSAQGLLTSSATTASQLLTTQALVQSQNPKHSPTAVLWCVQGASALSATVNSTQGLLASAASTAAQLLSNVSSSAAAAANLTANATQHMTAGGLESDLQLPGQLLNASATNSSSGSDSSLQLPGQALNGSADNTSSLGHLVNSTAANSSSVLRDGQERVASAAGGVVHDSKEAAAGLLSGVRSWFDQKSSNHSELYPHLLSFLVP